MIKNHHALFFANIKEANKWRKKFINAAWYNGQEYYPNAPIKDSKGRTRINIIKKYSNPDEEFKAIWRDDAPYRDLVTDLKMGERIHHGIQIQQWGRKKKNKGKG